MTIQMPSRFVVTCGALALAAVFGACTDDAPEATGTSAAAATAADPTGRPVTDAELARITSQPTFAETRELIAEEGGEIDLAGGLVYTYTNGVAGTETRFSVSAAEGQAPANDLVFQQADRDAYFYFLSQTANVAAEPTSSQGTGAQTSGLFGCGSWSSWAFVGTYCGNHFWCFGKAQKGTYAKFTRTRQCRNGIHQANRTDFVGCGC